VGSISLFLFVVMIGMLSHSYALAVDEFAESEEQVFAKDKPVYFSGDSFSYERETGIVTGTGDVRIVQESVRLRGDKVIVNLPRRLVEIEGNVIATRGEDIVKGARGIYDFEKEEGVFYDARGHSIPWYVTADTLEREPTGMYSVERASLTTCDLDRPHYRLEARSVDVIPDERVVARDLTLFAGPVPIFYFPYYSQDLGPRGSPFEFTAGTQSDVGAYARIGYNFEVGDQVLLNPHIWGFTKSGVAGGLDGRLSLFDGQGRGRFDSFYISDQNEDNTEEPGIDKDRGKADLYYRQTLSDYWTALLQIEYLSDREILKTFDFDDFAEREAPETFLNIDRTDEHSVISFITRVRLVDYITDVERVPGLRLELLEQELGDTGVFYNLSNESVYLNVDPDGPQSARNFTQARMAYPFRDLEWVTLVPFVEADGTYYSSTLDEDDEYRLSGSTGAIAQSHFQRIYDSPFARYTAFRHLIVPTVTYRVRPTPAEEPDELHQFDSVDLIDDENLVEVEVNNYLQAKRRDGARIEPLQHTVTVGFEFTDGDDKFALLENELLVRPFPQWELALKEQNDFRDESRSDIVSVTLRYVKPQSLRASFGVIHEDTVLIPFSTQLVYSLSKSLGPLWRAGFQQRYDISLEEFSYQEIWVWRDLHCWEAMLSVTDRQEATSFMLVFNIKAFPMSQIQRKTAIQPILERHAWPTRW
jgi:LPS-assembly protein